MKNFSNLYIFLFSSALVLIVAAALSFTALTLKPLQDKNVEIERQRNILSALQVESTAEDAEAKYNKYIKQSVVIKSNGSIVEGEIAKDIDLKKQNQKPVDERLLPIYIAEKDGKSYIVIPVRGTGLWGPIWGNVALDNDMSTIYGVNFDHSGETPGLGAEINTSGFQQQFVNKQIFDSSSKFVSVKVEKPGTYTPDNHTVDAISGGTITSKGLQDMLKNSLEPYQTYFSQHKSN
ncbi:MAG: NADH:ubiquinone reductase (Na(+)-transporting) subunit C [Bacteroidales bacterium]|jgi:Na+-transporting NADH:ubiquinone oxidoreductase subunit C|nr:NADH:ubiquinone reductase (Na(+)-transporting) subunit C [Bacteroidales bacterium]